MMFENTRQLEKALEDYVLSYDESGELGYIVSDSLSGMNVIMAFNDWLKKKAKRIEYKVLFEEPHHCNFTVNVKGDFAYKYFSDGKSNRDWLNFITEISNYFIFMTVIKEAVDYGILKPKVMKYFMEIVDLFYAENSAGQVQFGYITKRLFPSYFPKYLLKDVLKVFKIFEKLTTYGVYLSHGDMKIPNLMLDVYGQLKIIDFGLTSVKIFFKDKSIFRSFDDTDELMHVDPVVFFISFNNETNTPRSGNDFEFLDVYEKRADFIADAYTIAYKTFREYHLKQRFVLDVYLQKYSNSLSFTG